jgi:hypothetical protein
VFGVEDAIPFLNFYPLSSVFATPLAKKRDLSRERKYFLLAKQECLDGTAEDAYGSEAVTETASDDPGC